jgi:sugar-specific transcriptional regulator TrmB
MSEIIDKNILTNLQTLGLSGKEALVYVELLGSVGSIGSSVLVRGTGLHGQFVYDALYSLEEKGLAKHSIVNGRKKFEATALSRISNLIDEKRLIAEKTIDLLGVIVKKPLGQEFEVYQGEKAYIDHQFEMLEKVPDSGEILIVSTDWGEFYSDKHSDFFEKYEKKRKEKKVTVRFLLNEGLRRTVFQTKSTRTGTTYRFLPEHQSYSGICVFREFVDFYLMGEPIMVFTFKNSKIAEGYGNFFEVLWGLGKE